MTPTEPSRPIVTTATSDEGDDLAVTTSDADNFRRRRPRNVAERLTAELRRRGRLAPPTDIRTRGPHGSIAPSWADRTQGTLPTTPTHGTYGDRGRS